MEMTEVHDTQLTAMARSGPDAPLKCWLVPSPPVRVSLPSIPGQEHEIEIQMVHPEVHDTQLTAMARSGPDAPLKFLLVPSPPVKVSSPLPPGQGYMTTWYARLATMAKVPRVVQICYHEFHRSFVSRSSRINRFHHSP